MRELPVRRSATVRLRVLRAAFLLLIPAATLPGCSPESHQEPATTGEVATESAAGEASAGLARETGPDSSHDAAAGTSREAMNASSGGNAVDEKFDAALRHRLAGTPDAAGERPIQVLVELASGDEAAQRAALEAAGVRLITVAGRVATAEGSAAALRRAAALDFVRSLSLSQTNRPLGDR